MPVVYETWYKELKDPDTFYTKVTAIKLLEHLTEFCAGLHTVDAVDIPKLMKELYKDSDGVPQFINEMEAAQRNSKRAKLVINNEYLHDVALKLILQSGEYKTETRDWLKLTLASLSFCLRLNPFMKFHIQVVLYWRLWIGDHEVNFPGVPSIYD